MTWHKCNENHYYANYNGWQIVLEKAQGWIISIVYVGSEGTLRYNMNKGWSLPYAKRIARSMVVDLDWTIRNSPLNLGIVK